VAATACGSATAAIPPPVGDDAPAKPVAEGPDEAPDGTHVPLDAWDRLGDEGDDPEERETERLHNEGLVPRGSDAGSGDACRNLGSELLPC
jgi:hypothetical protein